MYAEMAYMRSIVVAFLLLAPAVQAATVTGLNVYPTYPTNVTPVTLAYRGYGADAGDTAAGPRVTVDRFRILVEFGYGRSCCTSATVAWDARVELGPLPAGNYEIVATVPDGAGREEHRAPLVVRDVTTVPFDAPAGRASTFDRSYIDWRFGEIVWFAIGGEDADADAGYTGRHDFSCYCAYRRPPGLYDVEVKWDDGVTKLARNAFEIYDERSGVPPILERFLVPAHFQGAGAAGSRWESELVLTYTGPGVEIAGAVPDVFRRRGAPHYDFIAEAGERRTGFVFGLPHRGVSEYGMRLRVRDAARSTTWTSVPIVRERDFFTRPVTVTELPYAPGTRLMLRMYVIDRKSAAFQVYTGPRYIQLAGTKSDAFAPVYAELDLSAIRQEGQPNFMTVQPLDRAPFWAVITATDTATGHIEIIELK